MSRQLFHLSLYSLLLHCLNLVSLVSSSPVGDRRDGANRRASGGSRSRVVSRDATIPFGDIGATFVLGSAESQLAPAGTYPRLARLSDGGILSISSYTDGNDRVLRVARSDDDGATFATISEVARSAGGDLDNGFLLQLPSGAVLAAFRNHDKNADGAYTYFRITVCRSDDGGRTWTFAAQAAETAASASGFNGLWEPFMRLGKDGGVQLTYSGELSQTNQETFRTLSYDGGATWSAPVNLRLHGENQQFRDGMQGIAATRDAASGQDALVMVFEVKDGDFFYVSTVTSYDDGNTWGSRNTIFRPSQHNAGAPQIATIGGNLAVVFMTDEDTTGALDWPAKADIKMIFSSELRDGQVTWDSQTMQISQDSSYWPSAFQKTSDSIIAVYERGNVPRGRTISSA
ncbi:glycoside hydrolase family 93 protein [Hypoxylon cercidicola]|nr:glycoside hydrolase family 93 protein [Hypoxylon cercidicola]